MQRFNLHKTDIVVCLATENCSQNGLGKRKGKSAHMPSAESVPKQAKCGQWERKQRSLAFVSSFPAIGNETIKRK